MVKLVQRFFVTAFMASINRFRELSYAPKDAPLADVINAMRRSAQPRRDSDRGPRGGGHLPNDPWEKQFQKVLKLKFRVPAFKDSEGEGSPHSYEQFGFFDATSS